jgi:hypothetical protein
MAEQNRAGGTLRAAVTESRRVVAEGLKLLPEAAKLRKE